MTRKHQAAGHTLDRDEAAKHLVRGWGVRGPDGNLIDPATRPHGKRSALLPAEADEFTRTRNDDGTMTRAEMETIIRNGGSVMHHGAIIDNVDDLPDEVQLAAGDVDRLEAEAERLEREGQRMETQHRQIRDAIAKAKDAREVAEKQQAEREATERETGKESTGGAGGGAAPKNYAELHVDELKAEAARSPEIEGHKQMHKADLVKALEKRDRDAGKTTRQ